MDQPVAAEIVNLHKTFKTGLGKPVVHAVRGIDMNIRQGEVYGLIGPNGSGKSTLMKALLGLVRPTEGSCSIFGRSSLAPDSKEEVGFLPENPYFYCIRWWLGSLGKKFGMRRRRRLLILFFLI